MIMTWRNREGWLTFVFCDDNRDVNEKERYGGWRWERSGGCEWIWEITGTTCPIGLGWPCISVITARIGTQTCCIGDAKLTRRWNSLKSQFLRMNSPIPSHLSLSCPQFYYHLRTQSSVMPFYLSMLWSTVNTEYSKHRVQHTPSSAFTEYSMHWVMHTPCNASSEDRLSSAPSKSIISQQTMWYSILYICTITSQPMNRVSMPIVPPSRTTASRVPAS